MNKIIIILIISLLFSSNLFSNNLIEDYQILNSKKSTSKIELRKISIIYQMGYQEKAILSLYKYIIENKDRDYDQIIENLGKFDSNILKTLNYLKDPINFKGDIEKLDKELIDIFKIKKEKLNIKESKSDIKIKEVNKKEIKKRLSFSKITNNAIVISESLDNINFLKVKELTEKFKFDNYFKLLNLYLNNKIDDTLLTMETPESYHYLYIYHKRKDSKKADKYLKLLKEKYPNYLRYNKL